jgi:purine catabolism regulator
VIYSLADLPAAYDQACTAVVVGRRRNGPGRIAHFDELGVHRLLSLQTDKSELRSFTDDVLKSLSADNAEAADLRLTLQTLLDCNCNVAEASRALHMHYNTLRYRIGKLESVVGSFTDDPVLRLNVSLALQVMKMHEMS